MFLNRTVGGIVVSLLLCSGLLYAEDEEQKRWSLGLTAEYFSNLQGVNPGSSFGMNAGWQADTYRFYVSQSFVKPYAVYEGENEFDASDTIISASRPLPSWIKGMNFSASASLSLPISHYSRRQEIYSKPMLSLAASEGFWDGTLFFSYSVNARLHWSKFQSEATGDGLGGRPLPRYSYGFGHGGRYLFYQDFTASYTLAYNEISYYSLEPVSSEALTVVDMPDQTYSVSFSLGYAVTKNLGTSFGWVHGSQIIHAGTTDLVIFDEDLSQWFFAGRYQF